MALLLNTEDFEWLRTNYPKLSINTISKFVEGEISLKIDYEGYRISDTYTIKVDFGKLDSMGLPKVFEVSGKIYEIAKKYNVEVDSLHINQDQSFCMVIPGKEKDIFKNGFTIQEFFQNAIEKFLFQMSYYEREGELPWGEYAHGYLGHIELYEEGEISLKELVDRLDKIELFQALITNRQSTCLCGSGIKLRKCHTGIFQGINKMKTEFQNTDLTSILRVWN